MQEVREGEKAEKSPKGLSPGLDEVRFYELEVSID